MKNIKLNCKDTEKLQKIINGEDEMMMNTVIKFYLVVDDVEVVEYKLILEKANGFAKGVSYAEIMYANLFYNCENENLKSQYLRKGYAKKGLQMLSALALNLNIPYLHLEINDDNLASQKVALGAGFLQNGHSYYKLHPNAKDLYLKSLGPKLEKSKDAFESRFDKFLTVLDNEEGTPKR